MRAAGSLALVVVVFVGVLPRIAGYGDAWDRLRQLSGEEAGLLAAVTTWNLATNAFVQMASLPGLTFRHAMTATQMSTAVANVMPGGGLLGIGVTASTLRSWGHPADAVTQTILLTGVWNSFFKLASPPVAVVLVVLFGDSHAPLAVSVVSVVVFAGLVACLVGVLRDGPAPRHLVGRFESLVAGVAARAGRPPVAGWVDAFDRFRASCETLVARRWVALSLTAIVSHLSLFAVLAVTASTLGVSHVSLLEAFVVFAVVRVALLLPLTPGGAGLAELGLAGSLVAAGAGRVDAVTVVLVFRALTWLLPIPLGGVAYLGWLSERRAR